MTPSPQDRAAEFYARTYDLVVPDWPGEIQFYRDLAAEARQKGGQVLEVGCGTGRIAIRLALAGVDVVGLDVSALLLAVAEEKSLGLQTMRWVLGDMRSFELDRRFDLVIIPGHAFQHLNTSQD